jgi:NAD(P)-dependent dehydrogenase (short-subunit alcohol dehydrogenase family)
MGTLSGQTIIVTGAAGSIGHATALVLAREGANLVLVDINSEQLDARAREVSATGARVRAVRADVSRSDDVRAYVDAACQDFGRIDGLFNNAGVEGDIAPTHEYDEAEFDRVIRINLKGVFLNMRHVLPLTTRRKHRQHRINRQ